MNPYGKALGDREPLDALEFSTRDYRDLISGAGPGIFARPLAPGKWTLGQLMVHLAHTELAFGMRFRMALTIPNYIVQPFDQDAWLAREPEMDGAEALAAWMAIRQMNLGLFRSFTGEDRQRRFHHPERGDLTVWDYVETLAGHDLHHLAQVRAVVAKPR
jgi:hypothetical protein